MPFPPVPVSHPIASADAVVTAPNVRFTVLTERLIRLEYNVVGRFEDRPSQVFWHREQPVPNYKKTVTDSSIEIETDFLHLKYQVTKKGFTPETLSIDLKQVGVTWSCGMAETENLKGTARTLDNASGKTRLENGLLSRSGWAVVDDSKSLVFNEAGWLTPRGHQFQTDLPKDFYFFGYGTDYSACLRDFTNIAGKIPMIPRYILGNWWSHYWEYSQDELKSLMEDFRSRDIPLSICIVDMDWHITKTGNTSDGWTGYTWNHELFPDPEGFVQWLHGQGLRTSLNLHPARGIHPHEEQYDAMAKWMGVNPASKQPIPFDIADPHFMEGYFAILHHPHESTSPLGRSDTGNAEVTGLKTGTDFWWMDWQQGKKSKIPDLDPLWFLNHLHFHDLGRDGRKRPFVFSRWGGLGNHRYPIGFSGDTFIRWSALAYQPYFTSTAANVAYGWWSHDIGGHMNLLKDGSPELYLRWVQFGVFSPIFRLHSTKQRILEHVLGLTKMPFLPKRKTSQPDFDRRPWSKPEHIFRAARAAMQFRHTLIPYIYSMAWRAHQTGISLVTPMYYGDNSNASAFEAKDQYYFGSELIVAPITAPSNPKTGLAAKRVWFPAGTWFNFFTGEALSGEQWHEIKASLDDIPVYAKAGAIIPLAPKVGWGGLDNPVELDIHIFPGADNTFDLYEDDGETTDYQSGKYAITRFELKDNTFTVHPAQGDLSVIPAKRTYHVHLQGVNVKEHLASFAITPSQAHTLTVHPSA